MKSKGSITCTMCLLLLVIISLLGACIRSSRISVGRVQAVNAMDTAMYSLFSQYDQDLLTDYHLFFLDGSYGKGSLNLAQVLAEAEAFTLPVLSSGLAPCRLESCGVNGFRLASDNSGEAVRAQIIRYMKDNLGSKGIQLIRNQLTRNKTAMEKQEMIQEGGLEEAPINQEAPMAEISETNNPLEIIENIRSHGFLGLVLPDGHQLSEKSLDLQSLLSRRELSHGFGELPLSQADGSAADKLLLQEYILDNLSYYTQSSHSGKLDYQAEYILGGKDSDQENLRYVVNRLLLIRETSNIAFLYTNPQKRAELQACASALSLLLLIPEGMALVQGILAAGWAYIESICDVKILLSGGKVPLTKDSASWKTQLNHLSTEASSSGSFGLDYREYLFLLLSFSSADTLTLRCMDMIEQNIRSIEGREYFSFDACLDALSLNFLISGPEEQQWQGERFYTYDM